MQVVFCCSLSYFADARNKNSAIFCHFCLTALDYCQKYCNNFPLQKQNIASYISVFDLIILIKEILLIIIYSILNYYLLLPLSVIFKCHSKILNRMTLPFYAALTHPTTVTIYSRFSSANVYCSSDFFIFNCDFHLPVQQYQPVWWQFFFILNRILGHVAYVDYVVFECFFIILLHSSFLLLYGGHTIPYMSLCRLQWYIFANL